MSSSLTFGSSIAAVMEEHMQYSRMISADIFQPQDRFNGVSAFRIAGAIALHDKSIIDTADLLDKFFNSSGEEAFNICALLVNEGAEKLTTKTNV